MVFSSIFMSVNGPDQVKEEEHNSIACPTTTNQHNKEYQRMLLLSVQRPAIMGSENTHFITQVNSIHQTVNFD